ncbi:hypothetical protein L208DRAFT_1161982, partial [Tricholoma matsutake]
PNGTTFNCNQSRTNLDFGGPQLDHLGPVPFSPWTEERLVWTVFCCKICHTYITHMYLGDHYPDS